MNRGTIVKALGKAQKGINQYLEIMCMFPNVDVSVDKGFQKKFNSFYRLRQRKERFYQTYYSYMEELKDKEVIFENVLRHIHSQLNRYEPSFSSKMVATHNPNLPIWDSIVLKNIGIKAPSYAAKDRMNKIITTYQSIREWYARFMDSDDGALIIEVFNERIKEADSITNLKKIDFAIWQLRNKVGLEHR